jgi:hypothetical protein
MGLNLTQCVDNIWTIMCAYDEWPCFIEMHVFLWKILYLIKVIFNLRFKLVIKGRVITNVGRFLHLKKIQKVDLCPCFKLDSKVYGLKVRVAIGTRLTKQPFTKNNWIRTWTSGAIPF